MGSTGAIPVILKNIFSIMIIHHPAKFHQSWSRTFEKIHKHRHRDKNIHADEKNTPEGEGGRGVQVPPCTKPGGRGARGQRKTRKKNVPFFLTLFLLPSNLSSIPDNTCLKSKF